MDPTYAMHQSELICGELLKVMQQTHVGPLKMNRYNNKAWGQHFDLLCSEEAEINAGITTLIKAILHENCLVEDFVWVYNVDFLKLTHSSDNNSGLHIQSVDGVVVRSRGAEDWRAIWFAWWLNIRARKCKVLNCLVTSRFANSTNEKMHESKRTYFTFRQPNVWITQIECSLVKNTMQRRCQPCLLISTVGKVSGGWERQKHTSK